MIFEKSHLYPPMLPAKDSREIVPMPAGVKRFKFQTEALPAPGESRESASGADPSQAEPNRANLNAC